MSRVSIIAISLVAFGCGTSITPSDGGGMDASPRTDSGPDVDGGRCLPVECDLFCENGFERGADGCEVCRCNPPPDDSCTSDDDCVIARDVTGCCYCEQGYRAARVAEEPCLVARRDAAPPGCLPDPDVCAVVDCELCEPIVRAVCNAGTCVGSADCATGDVVFMRRCAPACTAHTDCTVAADYAHCCGGCGPAPVAVVDDDPCLARRQSESSCAPGPGACDGLGCASPPSDCVMFGDGAVCMADGTCQNAGADGGCPSGTSDVGGVCVLD